MINTPAVASATPGAAPSPQLSEVSNQSALEQDDHQRATPRLWTNTGSDRLIQSNPSSPRAIPRPGTAAPRAAAATRPGQRSASRRSTTPHPPAAASTARPASSASAVWGSVDPVTAASRYATITLPVNSNATAASLRPTTGVSGRAAHTYRRSGHERPDRGSYDGPAMDNSCPTAYDGYRRRCVATAHVGRFTAAVDLGVRDASALVDGRATGAFLRWTALDDDRVTSMPAGWRSAATGDAGRRGSA